MKLTVDFQVELNNPEDKKLLDTVKDLKSHHKFTPTLKQALDLILDLRSGSTVVLFSLFPWLRGQGVQPSAPPADNTDIVREIKRLQQMMLERSTIPNTSDDYPQMQKAAAKPLLGQGVVMALPTFDEDIAFDVRANGNTDSSMNFISAMGLTQ